MRDRDLAGQGLMDSTCVKNAFLLNLIVDRLGLKIKYQDKDFAASNGETKQQLFKVLLGRLQTVRRVKLRDLEQAHHSLILMASRALITHCLYGNVAVDRHGLPMDEAHEDSSVL